MMMRITITMTATTTATTSITATKTEEMKTKKKIVLYTLPPVPNSYTFSPFGLKVESFFCGSIIFSAIFVTLVYFLSIRHPIYQNL